MLTVDLCIGGKGKRKAVIALEEKFGFISHLNFEGHLLMDARVIRYIFSRVNALFNALCLKLH